MSYDYPSSHNNSLPLKSEKKPFDLLFCNDLFTPAETIFDVLICVRFGIHYGQFGAELRRILRNLFEIVQNFQLNDKILFKIVQNFQLNDEIWATHS